MFATSRLLRIASALVTSSSWVSLVKCTGGCGCAHLGRGRGGVTCWVSSSSEASQLGHSAPQRPTGGEAGSSHTLDRNTSLKRNSETPFESVSQFPDTSSNTVSRSEINEMT
ncbi:unnamed protein product [Danaus chrysippus]|uniref:(African queen) hypothetical protein n=1 Tax=Danaus chrysippus TaxID=151541 RepID=A0A8J2VRU5_9NEOP|nr:unnamed protein product [Danaus chrysippus]